MSTATAQQNAPRTGQAPRATVVADMSMSLDGFVAEPGDGVERVFAWYSKPQPPREYSGLGVIVAGRRTFEIANGWGGKHPTGVPVIVVSHSIPDGWPRTDSAVMFNTEGIDSAIGQAREIAGGRDIALATPSIIRQCLDRGLVDRLQVSLVPLLLGSGIRLFENLASAPLELDEPTVTSGNGVTHLAYRCP